MRKLITLLALAAFAVACGDDRSSMSQPSTETLSQELVAPTGQGIVPTAYPGNFVASDDDQVCYELGLDVTAEMFGFKIDPPASYSNGYVSFTVSPDGKLLDWTSASNATVLGVVVKGGPSYNVYDYVGTGFTWDTGLSSPVSRKKLPDISHYNVCYERITAAAAGCTPGYWRNHADRWAGGSKEDDFDATFAVDAFDPDLRLADAIWLGGGGIQALARHATAGLLNSYGGVPNASGETVAYAYSTAEVLAMVKAAIDSGDPAQIEATKDLLAAANEAGCPLSGTAAIKVQ